MCAARGAAREVDGDEAVAPALTRELRLTSATVRFGAIMVLDDVLLTLPFGSITALVSPSGAGKTTLADLLGGLIAPDAGALLIDGVALDPAQRRGWRRRVAYVAQEPVLFAGTVRDNLLLAAPEADENNLQQSLKRAAAEFALTLPGGLDCPIGDGGRTLSGGEIQRLLLARALLTDPALLILDEATSALDPANEVLIAAALERLRGSMTIVIIAHHGALSALANQIIRLEGGRIAVNEGLDSEVVQSTSTIGSANRWKACRMFKPAHALLAVTALLASSALLLGSPATAKAGPPTGCTGTPSATWLGVKVDGVRNAKGQIAITLYPDDAGKFLAKGGALAVGRVKAVSGTTRGCIFLPKTGTYAIAIYHDENTNEKLDRNGILPAEGYGFTNNPSTMAGLPSFRSVRLNVAKSGMTTAIKLTYP